MTDAFASEPPSLLAIDLGLRSGFALYGADGRLRRFFSRSFASISTLKRAAYGVLGELGPLALVVVEGDRALGDVWLKAAEKRGARGMFVSPERWRATLLYAREQRSGKEAKKNADALARAIIEWSHAPRPTSLRHDAAEAILIGLWGVLEVGWLEGLPAELRR